MVWSSTDHRLYVVGGGRSLEDETEYTALTTIEYLQLPSGDDAIKPNASAAATTAAVANTKHTSFVPPIFQYLSTSADAVWKWIETPMNYGRIGAMAFIMDGNGGSSDGASVHVMAGHGKFGRRVQSVERYDKEKNEWIECPPAPVGLPMTGTVVVSALPPGSNRPAVHY